ncbi:MAG: WG repeat-containing protein [Bacteroidales bacterium]|nr:WG repeat-containing protein [Bacteroidales bacterium]
MKIFKQILLLALTMCSIMFVSCNSLLFNRNGLDIIPAEQDGEWGYIDMDGHYVVNPQFLAACQFADNGLAAVCAPNGKWGFVDKKGKYVVAAKYKCVTRFSNDLALVTASGEHISCIDETGRVIFVLPQAEEACAFSDGLALFRDNKGKCGYVNQMGKVVINPEYDAAMSFSEGLAAVKKGKKWGFVDTHGDMVIHPQFDEAGFFQEGMAVIRSGDRLGYIDKTGCYAINPQFRMCANFSEGLAVFTQGSTFGYIDKKGKIKIIIAAWDNERNNGSVNFVSANSGVMVNPLYREVDGNGFYNGLALVDFGGRCGYINKKGDIAINPQFDYATHFYGNRAFVRLDGKWGIIDKRGHYVANPQFDDIGRDLDGWSVTSDYYDSHAFIKAFFDMVGGNDANVFDGFSNTATLSDLTKSHYHNIQIDNATTMRELLNRDLTDEIRLQSVRFHFADAVMLNTNTRDFYWGYTHNKGRNLSSPLTTIVYTFQLYGNAAVKQEAIVDALRKEIVTRYGDEMLYNADLKTFFELNGNIGIALSYDENKVYLVVDLTTTHTDLTVPRHSVIDDAITVAEVSKTPPATKTAPKQQAAAKQPAKPAPAAPSAVKTTAKSVSTAKTIADSTKKAKNSKAAPDDDDDDDDMAEASE